MGAITNTLGGAHVIAAGGNPSALVLVAAGAAGSVFTMFMRVTAVPSDVAAHDRRIADIDTDLNRFAADEYVRLSFQLREIRFPGGQPSQAPDRGISLECALAVVNSTQLYRDEQNARMRERRELLAAEGRPHRAWRWLRQRPVPGLMTPVVASQLVDKWQTLVPSYGTAGSAVRLIDPRERTIARVAPELEQDADKPN